MIVSMPDPRKTNDRYRAYYFQYYVINTVVYISRLYVLREPIKKYELLAFFSFEAYRAE